MKSTKNMITMKSIYLLAALLGLQFNTTFATGNYSESTASLSTTVNTTIINSLAPMAPREANFEEITCFNDEAPAPETNISNLSPVTPSVADFEDEPAGNVQIIVRNLAPVTPKDADFEDHI